MAGLVQRLTALALATLAILTLLGRPGPLSAETWYVAPLTDTGLPGETFGPYRGYYGPATVARIQPVRIAAGPDGSLYIAEPDGLLRVTPDGILVPLTGRNGEPGGDGGPSVAALLDSPGGVAADSAGNVYIVSSGQGGLRRINTDGTIHTVSPVPAGTGMDIGPDGNIYIAGDRKVWKVTPLGRVSIEAGAGQTGFPSRNEADIEPADVAVDAAGNLYIAEANRRLIRKIQPDGSLVIVAGGGDGDRKNPGVPAPETFIGIPTSVDVDAGGNVYFTDVSIYKVGPDLRYQEFSRVWERCAPVSTLPGGAYLLSREAAVAPDGGIYVLHDPLRDVGGDAAIVRIGPEGAIRHVAGCFSRDCHSEGMTVRRSQFGSTRGLAFDPQGNLFAVAGGEDRVWKMMPDLSTATVPGYEPGCAVYEGNLHDIAVDSAGALFVSRASHSVVDRIRPGGTVEWFAGMPNFKTPGDTPATRVLFGNPEGLAVDPDGNLLIGSERDVHRVTPQGEIERIFSTDVYPGTDFFRPRGLALRDDGTLLAAGIEMHRVVTVVPNAGWQPFAGTGEPGLDGDGGPAAEARLAGPVDTAIDDAGNTFIADRTIRRVSPGGIIDTLDPRDARDPGRAVSLVPNAIAIDPQRRLYISNDNGVYIAAAGAAELPDFGPSIHWTGVLHGATFEFKAIAPGEIISVFGEGLGPSPPAVGAINDDRLSDSLAGFRVLFDGELSPILFASDRQINCIAPFSIGGKTSVAIEVEHLGRRSNTVRLPVIAAAPGVFEVRPYESAILNQDYTLNAPENPAREGEAVMIYATGFGQTEPPSEDGRIYRDVLPRAALPVTATVGGLSAAVLYSGAAPGFVAGAIQANVLIPHGIALPEDGRVPLVVRVGNTPAQSRVRVFVEEASQ